MESAALLGARAGHGAMSPLLPWRGPWILCLLPALAGGEQNLDPLPPSHPPPKCSPWHLGQQRPDQVATPASQGKRWQVATRPMRR